MENDTQPNVAELVAVYQLIRDNPAEHAQGWYGRRTECGTTYCFAGHVAVRAGARAVWDTAIAFPALADMVVTEHGRELGIDEVAADILGLTNDQAEYLFSGVNTLADIRSLIIDITGVDPETVEVQS